jgi:transcriptional regulator with XRE-family HTH domain
MRFFRSIRAAMLRRFATGWDPMPRFSRVAGEALREARIERGLTLNDVRVLSNGRFKPSALGGYERGERALSLDRFCELAELYRIPPDRVLAVALTRIDPDARREVVIDLTRLSLVDEDDRLAVAEYVHRVKAQREDYLSDVITLRSGDIEELALSAGRRAPGLIAKLRPAIMSGEPTGQ